MFATLRHDTWYAARSLRRAPGFAVAAITTLALGIGATTAVSSVVYGVLLRPLPYPEADRLVRLSEGFQGAAPLRPGALLGSVTYYAWKDAGSRTLDAIEAYTEPGDGVIDAGGTRDLIHVARVTPGLFRLLGVTPLAGRVFVDDDGAEGRTPVVVLSERFWRERFAADPAIVGRTVFFGGQACTIAGVTQAGFTFPDRNTDLWGILTVPRPTGPVPNPAFSSLLAVGRLKPGVTPAQVAAEGTAIAQRRDPKPLAARLTFGDGGPAFVRVRTMIEEMTSGVRDALIVVSAGVGCILLIACVNVANLLLSRGAARRRELAVRTALGAGRARLVRLVLTESLVLSAAGGGLGLVIAFSAVRMAATLAPADFPRLDDIAVDVPVLMIAFLATGLTALASALPPILHDTRVAPAAAFRTGGSPTAAGHRGGWMRSSLLVAEAMFGVVMLVAALLLGRSFVRLMQVDPGYTAEHVTVATVFRPGTDDGSARRYGPVMSAALERIRSIPGVQSAGIGSPTPLDDNNSLQAFPVPGSAMNQAPPGAQPTQAPRTALARGYSISPGYERALGLRLRAGRFFTEGDQIGDEVRWIVNEEFARLYLPPNPVGRRFPWTRRGRPGQLEIIGVVGNVLKNGNSEAPRAELYGLRRDTDPFYNAAVVVRSTGDPEALMPALRAAVREVAPDATLSIVPLAARVSKSVAKPRFAAIVLVAMALLASLLTAVGLLASLSYNLAQRRREFGVRVAVGATRRDLVRMVLRQGVMPNAVGILIGMAAAAGVTRLMRGVLFGVGPLDAVSFLAAPALLIPVAVLACLVPALRAARVDPMSVLKVE